MAMTKKDFDGIAGAFRHVALGLIVEDRSDELRAVFYAAERVAEYLKTTNPNFNRERFWAACTGTDYIDANGRTWRYSK
jgi:hypothetical protein